jgi:hypothetical protein
VFALAWWDTYQYNVTRVHAIKDNGKKVYVPTNFFTVNSLHFVSHFSSFKKYAPTKGMWTSGFRSHLEKSKSCSLPLVENKNANAVRIARKQIEAIIQHTHHNALEKSLDLKPPAFNLGYYHSFSRFLSEYEFEKINLDEIAAYEISLESGCLPTQSDWPIDDKKVLYTESWRVDVKGRRHLKKY